MLSVGLQANPTPKTLNPNIALHPKICKINYPGQSNPLTIQLVQPFVKRLGNLLGPWDGPKSAPWPFPPPLLRGLRGKRGVLTAFTIGASIITYTIVGVHYYHL